MNPQYDYAKPENIVEGGRIHTGTLSGSKIDPLALMIQSVGDNSFTYTVIDDEKLRTMKTITEDGHVWRKSSDGLTRPLFVLKTPRAAGRRRKTRRRRHQRKTRRSRK